MQDLGMLIALAGGLGGHLPFNETHPFTPPDSGAFKSKGRYRKGTDTGAGKANKLRKRRAKKGYR